MSDNFGSGQNRVLEVHDRSFDNVVFQHRRPPLSSEWNLINQISSKKLQDQVRVQMPSGFTVVEDILQDLPEGASIAGQVLTSESYLENSFKLISKNKNWVVVNGWPILLQGVNTLTEDNIITLNEPGTQRYDFVFLEVWRKLVSSSDPLYPLGNTHITPYLDNEIEWDAVGAETTKRVQIQYRVRVKSLSTDLNTHSVGFNDATVRPIGGRTDIDPYRQFQSAGSNDISLWIAGDGSDAAKNELNTVDGYVYALPMFMVNRRDPNAFSRYNLNGSAITKQNSLNGSSKDRPDGYLRDVVYREDIIDLRNKLVSSSQDLEDIMETSIRKLIKGQLNTSINKGYGDGNVRVGSASRGSIITKFEQINSLSAPEMGVGSSSDPYYFKKRTFVNSSIELTNNIVELPKNGSGVWESGTYTIDQSYLTSVGFPEGKITSVNAIFSKDIVVSGVFPILDVNTGEIEVTIRTDSPIVGTSVGMYILFDYEKYASDEGTKDIPDMFLEANKGGSLPIAFKSRNVPIRYTNGGDVLDFSVTGNSGDSSPDDYVHNAGADYDTNYDFGHDLVVHRSASSSSVNIGLSQGKLNGYYILGVKTIQVWDGSSYGSPVTFNVSRSVSTSVDNYIVTVTEAGVDPSANLRITLYTGSKPQESLGQAIAPSDSMKYFLESRHGKGVIDTYETIEVYASETSSGVYTFDTNDKMIIALGTKTSTSGSGSIVGTIFAFDPSGNLITNITKDTQSNINSRLPMTGSPVSTDFVPNKMSVEASPGLGYIKIPVIVHSYVASGETYDIYYKFSPYQGLLTSTDEIKGKIIKRGKALVTTLGSGRVLPESISLSNVIGRLPSYEIEDYKFNSESMAFSNFLNPMKELDVPFAVQDMLDSIPNDFVLGSNSKSNSRGRYDLSLTESGNPSYSRDNTRLIMEYGFLSTALSDGGLKKVFQFYLMRASNSPVSGDNDITGRVYLVVVASESGNNTINNKIDGLTNKDSIDIFELCGRPVIK
jgi:hypothetical protein